MTLFGSQDWWGEAPEWPQHFRGAERALRLQVGLHQFVAEPSRARI
jgi:hypothetical protein